MTLNLTEVEFAASNDDPQGDSDSSPPLNVEEQLEFSAGFGTPLDLDLDGFNDHGVRKNETDDEELESVDVVYEAMEPGDPEDRNGVRITREFLESVAERDYSGKPYMLGHSNQPLDEVGKIQRVWFDDQAEKLMIMNRVFNTGAQTHDEVISRLTHEPPTMTDGSVGFGDQYEAVVNDDGEPELVDGEIREFSTTPFPGGYDDGGLGLPNAAFADAVTDAVEFDDAGQEESAENPAFSDAVSTETISF